MCVARVRKHTHPLLGHSTAAWAASIKAAVFYQFFFTGHIYATHFNCLSEMAAELLVWWTVELTPELCTSRTALLLWMKHLICCTACACHNKKSLKCNAPLDFVRPTNATPSSPPKLARRTSLASTVGPPAAFRVFHKFHHCIFSVFTGFSGIAVSRAVAMPVTMDSACSRVLQVVCLFDCRSEVQVSHCRERTWELHLLIKKISKDCNAETRQLPLG